jgi:hypothetical protein
MNARSSEFSYRQYRVLSVSILRPGQATKGAAVVLSAVPAKAENRREE